jgi:elongation factor Ts
MMESIKKLREVTGAGMMDVKKALSDAGGDEDKAIALLRERGIVKGNKDRSDRETKEGLVAFVISPDKKSGALVEVNTETDFVARNADFQALVKGFAQTLLNSKAADAEALKASIGQAGTTLAEELAAAVGKIGESLVLNRIQYIETDGVVAGYVHSNGKIGVLVELGEISDLEASSTIAKDIALHVAAEHPRYLTRDEVNQDDLEKEREILSNKALNEGKPQAMVEKIVAGQLAKFYEEKVLLEQKFVKDNAVKVQNTLKGASLRRFVRFEIGS